MRPEAAARRHLRRRLESVSAGRARRGLPETREAPRPPWGLAARVASAAPSITSLTPRGAPGQRLDDMLRFVKQQRALAASRACASARVGLDSDCACSCRVVRVWIVAALSLVSMSACELVPECCPAGSADLGKRFVLHSGPNLIIFNVG